MDSNKRDYLDYVKDSVQEFFSNYHVLIRYVRDPKLSKNNGIRGVVLAYCHNNTIYYGWSIIHPLDKHSKYVGVMKAIKRAINSEPLTDHAKRILEDEYEIMRVRAKKYFKQAEEVKVNNNVTSTAILSEF